MKQDAHELMTRLCEVLSESHSHALDAHAPDVLAPDVFEPEVLAPHVLAPEVLAPEVLAPEVLAPEVLALGVFAPEVLAPTVLGATRTAPDVLAPQVLAPEVLAPEVHRLYRAMCNQAHDFSTEIIAGRAMCTATKRMNSYSKLMIDCERFLFEPCARRQCACE